MKNTCTACGRTESEAIADAQSLGLEQDFQNGIYTCCQIAQWADEQSWAWFEATQPDSKCIDDVTGKPVMDETDALFVPVRLRKPQVPWYRSPDNPA